MPMGASRLGMLASLWSIGNISIKIIIIVIIIIIIIIIIK